MKLNRIICAAVLAAGLTVSPLTSGLAGAVPLDPPPSPVNPPEPGPHLAPTAPTAEAPPHSGGGGPHSGGGGMTGSMHTP